MHLSNSLSRQLDRIGLAATLALPLFLTHGRGLAEAAMDILGVLFLLRSAFGLGWQWARRPWFVVSLIWWGWQVLCSVPVAPLGIGGAPAFEQSILVVRFLLMAAALQNWTLQDSTARRWMCILICACGLYIVVQILAQAIIGYNLFGVPRFPDGTLTGPYTHPRAAAPLSRLALPIMMLGCAWIISRARDASPWRAIAGSGLVTIAGVAVMILAGQRIPFALTLLGLFICAVLYRPLRPAALMAALALPVLVALARVLSPGSFRHLVLLAEKQLGNFGHSSYGAIFTRALVMARDNLWTGLGYDAFRHGCADSRFFVGLSWLNAAPDGGGAAICVQHAHNHYLQALTNAGIPGLILFVAMVVAWLMAIWPRERPAEGPMAMAWRIGLFAALFMQEWPIASSSDLINLPLGGWAFLLFGIALAESLPPVAVGSAGLYAKPINSPRT